MKRRYNKFLTLLLIGFQSALFASGGQYKNTAKFENKIAFYLFRGQYRKAEKTNNGLIKKLHSFHKGNSVKEGEALVRKAFINEEIGLIDNVETTIKKGLDMIKSAEGEKSEAYIRGLNYAAKAWYNWGDYIKMAEYVNALESNIDAHKENKKLVANALQIRADYYMALGYFSKAKKLVRDVIELRKDLISNTKLIKDKSGKAKQVKLSKGEINLLKREYCFALNQLSEVFLARGEYNTVEDSLYQSHKMIITKQVGNNDIAYIQNEFIKGSVYYHTRYFFKAVAPLMDVEEKSAKADDGYVYSKVCRSYRDIYKKLLISHYWNNNVREIDDITSVYETQTEREFKKDGIIKGERLYLEILNFFINKSDVAKEVDLSAKRRLKGEEELINLLEKKNYFPEGHLLTLEPYKRLMYMYASTDRIDKAYEILGKYMMVVNKNYPKDCPAYHKAKLEKTVFLLRYSNKFKQVEQEFKESFFRVVAKVYHPRHEHYMYFYNEHTELLRLTDRFKEGIKQAKATSNLVRKNYGSRTIQFALQLDKEANFSMDLGYFTEARDLLDRAGSIMNKNVNHKLRAKIYETKARYYNTMGDFSSATKMLEKASEITTLSSIEGYADLYIGKGFYQKAREKLLSQIENITSRYGSDHRSLITAYNRLAQLKLVTGEEIEAEKLVEKSNELCKKIYSDTSYLYIQNEMLLAKIYMQLGDYYGAEKVNLRIINNLTKLFNTRNQVPVALAINELAKAKYLHEGDEKEVEELFNEARTIVENRLRDPEDNSKPDNNPIRARILKDIAGFYIDQGRLKEAEELLEIVEGSFKKGTIENAEVNVLLGDIKKEKGEYDAAGVHYNRAVNRLKDIFEEKPLLYYSALSKTGQIYHIKGQTKKAIKTIEETTDAYLTIIKSRFKYLSEKGKKEFWNMVKPDFEFYNTIAFANRNEDSRFVGKVYDIALSTKALLLTSSKKLRKSILSSGDTVLIDKFNRWLKLQDELNVYQSMDAESLQEAGIDKEEIKKQISTIEREMSEASATFASAKKRRAQDGIVTWKQVQSVLKDNEYAIEIIRYRYFDKSFTDSIIYAALIVSKETKGRPEVVFLTNGNKIETKYFKSYKNKIKFRLKDKKSYKYFWKPIAEKITSDATVFLSLEGIYNQINVEALRDKEGKYVIEHNDIVLVSNTKDVYERRHEQELKEALIKKGKLKAPEPQKSSVMIIGNPAFYEVRVNPEDTVYITRNDEVLASTDYEILIKAEDGIYAKDYHQVLIYERDNIFAEERDRIKLKSSDSIYAHKEDKIIISALDSVWDKSLNRYISEEDNRIATLEDSIFITSDNLIVAKKYHERTIKWLDGIYAKPYHKKLITAKDKVFLDQRDGVYIEEKHKIVNEDLYASMSIKQLEGAEKEAKLIADECRENKWSVEIKLFADAYETSLEKFIEKNGKSPTVLHISTHGFFEGDTKKKKKGIIGLSKLRSNSDPLQKNGVLFRNAGDIFKEHKTGYADLNRREGVLTAAEVLAYNFDNTEMVVLSACETGRGEITVGEGVYGLQRSFLVAGAHIVVMSLFKVDDEATQELMRLFYEGFTKTSNYRESFRNAKLQLLKDPKYNKPIYWGAFIMMGME